MLCRIAYIPLLSASIFAADDGAQIYQQHCAQCHESGAARIPTQNVLRQHTSAAIANVLEMGVMKQQAASLAPAERYTVAQWLGSNDPVTVDLSRVANTCKSSLKTPTSKQAGWTAWGTNLENWRFQKSAGLAASDVPRLKLKWAFAVPNTTAIRSQPIVSGGRVFFAAETNLYALDAASGCTYWATELPAPVRSGVTLATVGDTPMLVFGDSAGQLNAFDSRTGKSLWKARPETHPATLLTAAPAFYNGVLYVPTASLEEVLATAPNYHCCTFRGSVSALDAVSGKALWKTYTIDQATSKAPGSSGAGIWSPPTIDTKARVLYVTTGDNYSSPATDTSDALLALDLATGEIKWKKQLLSGDTFNVGCLRPGKVGCPDSAGPDFDFGSPAILTQLANGSRLLVLAQKSGAVYAIDTEHDHRIVWQSQAGKGGYLGGIEWGAAFDGAKVFTAVSDLAFLPPTAPGVEGGMDPSKGGGLFAFKIENGERMWMTPSIPCGERRPCSPSQSAPVSAIPGVVFSGALDGHIRAYSTVDGKAIWDYDTQHEYQTVNGMAGKGGSLNAAGPVIADGTLLVGSGYNQFSQATGNVLLAFTIDGR